MNQHLKTVLNFIKQSKELSADEKNNISKAVQNADDELENKNRELEIESSLERVRTVAMGMKKPDDILDICKIMFTELQSLGFPDLRNTLINLWDDAHDSLIDYDYSDYTGRNKAKLAYSSHPVFEQFQKKIKKSKDAFAKLVVKKDQLESWKQRRRESGEYEDSRLNNITALYYYFYSIGVGAIGISTFSSLTAEKQNLLKRFRNVFDFAYRRYMDVAQAEAQAKEAQIELALERVRARTMAMHQSDEITEVVKLVYLEFDKLKINNESTDIEIGLIDEETGIASIWAHFYLSDGTISTFKFPFSHFEGISISDEYKNWKATPAEQRKDIFITSIFSGERWKQFIEKADELPELSEIFRPLKEAKITQWVTHNAYFSHGLITLQGTEPYAPETLEIQKRFAAVFEQTYTRFLDLQKAEAQAREAQIELGLERVRARAMAMQNSNELSELVDTVFKELTKLDFALTWCIINIIDESSLTNTVWAANPDIDKAPESYYMKFEDYPYHHAMMKGWNERKTKSVYVLEGLEKQIYDDYLFAETEFKRTPEIAQAASRAMEKYVCSFSFSNFGGLQTVGDAPLSEANLDILSRFGKVFDLTYTRFNDLKLAEAQVREAQIEAALERVRSRTMGMQKSEELKEVIQVVYDQFVHLNIKIEHTGFVIDYKARDDYDIWIADPLGVPSQVTVPYFDSVYYNRFNEAKEKGEDFFATNLSFEEKNKFYQKLFEYVPGLPEQAKEFYFSCPALAASTVLLENVCLYIENFSGTPYTDEENNTLMRFGKVFQQTYTRFLDLQKAEAQAREAQIEAALERVRSRAMVMQKPGELVEVAQLLRREMGSLGVEELETSSIYIHDETSGTTECWYAIQDIRGEDKTLVTDYMTIHLNDTWVGREMLKFYESGQKQTSILMQGENRKEWIIYCSQHSKVLQGYYGDTIPERTYHLLKFSNGYMGAASPGNISAESWELLKRATTVFSLAYTRFLDLQKAEAQTREAKIEVALERVRSKAMAMQKSDDLAAAVAIVFDELDKLNMGMLRCGIGILNKEKRSADVWSTTKSDHGTIVQVSGDEPIVHPLLEGAFDAWLRQGDFSYLLQGEDLNNYYKGLTTTNFKLPDSQSIVSANEDQQQYYYVTAFQAGNLYAFRETPFPDEAKAVMKRFADVFNLTYTRFLDLQKAEAQAKESQLERKRSEDLLLNILPEEIANELKQFGKSYARKHDEVTVLFADIKGFSTIAENLSAEELVNQLDECFRAFDHIVEKHGLEKIKTVGDAYVCACGLPKPVPDNAVRAVKAALDMLNFIKGFAVTKTIQDLPAFDFRIGIHTGPVITGVVGLKKFTYDIWGDAVNMAARMEQHGEAGKINISGSTYALIKDKFKCTYRGKIEAKNKGEVDMYFVEV